MFRTRMFTRALAATAVAGIALLGPAAAAGAATPGETEPSVPPVSIGLDLGIATVQIGSDPAVTPADPGTTVQAPAGIDVSVEVGRPDGSAAPVAEPVPAVPETPVVPGAETPPVPRRLVSADTSVDACIAAALLAGRAIDGCGLPEGAPAPTLAEALARVGACARLAIAADEPVSPCGTAPDTGENETGETGETGDAAFPPALARLDTEDRLCLTAAVVGGVDPAGCALEENEAGDGDDVAFPPAIAALETDDQLCLSAVILGGVDPSTCSIGDTAADDPTSAGADVIGAEGDVDVCLGLAVLTDGDLSACPAEVAGEQVDGSDPDSEVGAGGIGSGATGGLAAESVSPPGEPDGGSDAGLSGALPFTGAATGDLVLVGLAAVAVGLATRRAARAGSRVGSRG